MTDAEIVRDEIECCISDLNVIGGYDETITDAVTVLRKAADLIERQAARIAELEGQLESAIESRAE